MRVTRLEHRKNDGGVMTLVEIEVGTDLYQETCELREQVLRTPLGLPLSAGDIERDPDCFHLAAHDGCRVIAVLLLQPIDATQLKMRQVAVSPEFQRRGIGTRLLAHAEHFAKERGYHTVLAHARESAVRFYEKRGYVVSGSHFLEHTVAHRLVTKQL